MTEIIKMRAVKIKQITAHIHIDKLQKITKVPIFYVRLIVLSVYTY